MGDAQEHSGPVRHCTHCGGAVTYKGLKQIHEGQRNNVLMSTMACEVYVCETCGHIEFFYPDR